MTLIQVGHKHATSYPPPLGNVLLLGCMDLRLLDNTGDFMNHDNLTNRYDHVIFAGAALGVLKGSSDRVDDPASPQKSLWKDVFFHHLEAAHHLHGVEDVYILEHRHCGAYHKVFKVSPDFGDSPEEQEAEAKCHRKYAQQLEEEITAWADRKQITMRTLSFLMDVRGDVSLLCGPHKPRRKRKSH